MNEDEAWDKYIWQFERHLDEDIMSPLRLYGQGEYVDTAIKEIVSLSLQLHQKLSGIDEEPYRINHDKLHW